jgi:arylsulfatase A-like enzyme
MEKWAKYRDKAAELGIADSGFYMGKYLPIRQVQDNPVYAGLVEQMDDAIGVVLSALDDLGLEENTIVIFTSDNGGVAAGDAFATSNLPLKAGKGYQFEGGIREPYFIKVPWMDHRGTLCQVPVTGTDFYPTLLELTGEKLRPDEHIDGVSLLPLLRGERIKERPLVWHYPHYGNQGGEPSSMIRIGDWKLIHYYEDGRRELYNLAQDKGEHHELSSEYPELVESLHEQLSSYLEEVGARYPAHDPEYDNEKEEAHLLDVKTRRKLALENQRLQFLSEEFDPGNDWWGSRVTRD